MLFSPLGAHLGVNTRLKEPCRLLLFNMQGCALTYLFFF